VKLFGLLALLFVGASVAIGGTRTARVLGGFGVNMTLPPGWHGLAGPGQLQAADFRLGERALESPEVARVPRGHVHLIVWDYGPAVPYLTDFRSARTPLSLGSGNLIDAPLEGFPSTDTYAVRTVRLDEELVELVADLGPKPFSATALRKVNRVLATLDVQPPRIARPRGRRLSSGGVAMRLLPGWRGRIEIPRDRHAADLVFRAQRGGISVVLLELAEVGERHADLPVRVTGRNILPGHGPLIARRVFSTAGRGFDLSVVVPSVGELAIANRFLRTLTAIPRPWTFRSCDLSIRLPGTWRAAIDPRSGCYPVVTLRGPGVLIVVTELRSSEPAGGGRLLVRAGRRFRIEVTPRSALGEASAILASLRAKPRS